MADTKTTTPEGLQKKLLRLQSSCRALLRDGSSGTGGKFAYQYVTGSKLFGVIRPMMDQLGLRLTQDVILDSYRIEGQNAIIPFEFTWIDTESGERESHIWLACGSNTPLDKAIGSAATYAERYFVMKQLHLATDEDDTDALTDEDFQEKKPAPKAKPAPKPATKPAPAPVPQPELIAKTPSMFSKHYSVPDGIKNLDETRYNTTVIKVATKAEDSDHIEKILRTRYAFDDFQINMFRADVADLQKTLN